MYKQKSEEFMNKISSKEIDWDEVDNKLLEMRLASEEFLADALR